MRGDNTRAAALLAEMCSVLAAQCDHIRYGGQRFVPGAVHFQRLQVLSLAEKSGVEINERICTAFLRGCLVHGDVDPRCHSRGAWQGWSAPLAGPAAEYAAQALHGPRAAEAEELVKHANLKSTAELEAAARGYKAAAAASSRLSVCAAPKPAAQASSERPWWEMGASEVVDGSAALHLALADAHAALLDWPKARHRLSLARARIASGLDAKLHADRDGDLGDGGAAGGGDAYTNSGLLSNFLKHREAEAKQELERLQARVDAAEREAACDPERRRTPPTPWWAPSASATTRPAAATATATAAAAAARAVRRRSAAQVSEAHRAAVRPHRPTERLDHPTGERARRVQRKLCRRGERLWP